MARQDARLCETYHRPTARDALGPGVVGAEGSLRGSRIRLRRRRWGRCRSMALRGVQLGGVRDKGIEGNIEMGPAYGHQVR